LSDISPQNATGNRYDQGCGGESGTGYVEIQFQGGFPQGEKLLLSAIANWQAKNEGAKIEESNLVVKEANVDQSRTLKRIQPAPQGRAHRIKKRSNHVTMVVGSLNAVEEQEVLQEQENQA
jgi:large subunit ribosomal protein L22